jgi:hypothetical protein
MSGVDEVKPIITEEQAAALRQSIAEAFQPVADAAKAVAAAFVNAAGEAFREIAASIEQGQRRG